MIKHSLKTTLNIIHSNILRNPLHKENIPQDKELCNECGSVLTVYHDVDLQLGEEYAYFYCKVYK